MLHLKIDIFLSMDTSANSLIVSLIIFLFPIYKKIISKFKKKNFSSKIELFIINFLKIPCYCFSIQWVHLATFWLNILLCFSICIECFSDFTFSAVCNNVGLKAVLTRQAPFSRPLFIAGMKEPFQPKSKTDDETVDSFFQRRFGGE